MYAAYDALSPALRAFLDPLTAEHASRRVDAALDKRMNIVRRNDGRVVSHHPVVRVHPETGRRALFVSESWTTRIDGLSDAESAAVLRFLLGHVDSPEWSVRFRWEEGSVAMWDERCTLHLAVPDYTQRRVMHRCLLRGDRPRGVAGAARAFAGPPAA
jgi:taurine dioxygenase